MIYLYTKQGPTKAKWMQARVYRVAPDRDPIDGPECIADKIRWQLGATAGELHEVWYQAIFPTLPKATQDAILAEDVHGDKRLTWDMQERYGIIVWHLP